ncbi:MAG: OmpA family protein [Gammaproteobacteria bacterium]|nr:OmpA family protein [Gammaproteobacteria bacterium]
MPKTAAIIVTALFTALATSVFAEPENSLLKAATSTPVSDHQAPAPIIEASIDEPVTLTPNSSNSDDSTHHSEITQHNEHNTGPATIAFVHLTNIAFADEQVELSPQQTNAIDKAIARIQHNGGSQKSVLVTAHADDSGNDSQNLQLSHARATNVADYLKKQGVIDNVIRTHSFGRSQPRGENWTENGRQLNRRVSITLIKSTPG